MVKSKKKQIHRNTKHLKQQILPLRFLKRFQNIIKAFECSYYPKGIREADKILNEFPYNGETLCLKGLCMLSLKKRKGSELIKNGLKYNIKSQVCWHSFGLMHQLNLDYHQSINSLINALKNSKENIRLIESFTLKFFFNKEKLTLYL